MINGGKIKWKLEKELRNLKPASRVEVKGWAVSLAVLPSFMNT